MTYYLHVTQAEDGCDYTIGCGSALVELKATELGAAMLSEIVRTLGNMGFDSDEQTLGEMVLLASVDGADAMLAACRDEHDGYLAAEVANEKQREIQALEAQIAKLRARP